MPPVFSLSHIINGFLRAHKLEECNELFTTGGPHTTPHPTTIYPGVPSPWRSATIFIILLGLCLSFILVEQYARVKLGNTGLFMGAVTVGSVFTPLSLLLLLSELNLWRNIQLLRLGYLVAGGGLLSIIFVLLLFMFRTAAPLGPVSYPYLIWSSLLTGTVEETAKVVACVVLAGSALRNGRILNGLLIGAAVGAGFSLIENMGYTFKDLLVQDEAGHTVINYEEALSTMGARALFCMTAGHIMWGAVTGGALWAFHRHRRFRHALHQPGFLLVLLFCILLHSGWNFCWSINESPLALPVLCLFTWGALGMVAAKGIRQVRDAQRLWFDTSSETEEIFQLQQEDGTWGKPVTAARLQELLESGRITRETPCRAGDCATAVPVSSLSFIPKAQERISLWWKVPHCNWYRASFVLGAAQLISLAAAILRQDSVIAAAVFAGSLMGELILNLCWLIQLWGRALRRFPQTKEESAVAACSPPSEASLWRRMLIPVYNLAWGYQLYVQIVRRFNAMNRFKDSIPLWIPRLYWGNIIAAVVLLATMALLHDGSSTMWHFLILLLLYPVLAFFMARALNCIHRALLPQQSPKNRASKK